MLAITGGVHERSALAFSLDGGTATLLDVMLFPLAVLLGKWFRFQAEDRHRCPIRQRGFRWERQRRSAKSRRLIGPSTSIRPHAASFADRLLRLVER